MFCFFIAIPILGETGGKSVLGLVLISILPVLLLVLLVMFIISKFKKK
jgi:LPXTG-motif cell wall-anchored protein